MAVIETPSDFIGHCSLAHEKPPHQLTDEKLVIVHETLLNHNYEIGERIGAGGFATIFKARHTGYNQVFAIKVMDLEEGGPKCAEVANGLPLLHPNVIKIYETFYDCDFYYLVMEYCSGGSLKERVLRDGPLAYRTFRSVAEQLLRALGYCHSMGIAHLDIKPPNVFFDNYDRVRLADFGLSRPFDAESSFGGSIPYMPPEIVSRVRGFDPAKADIWSLGITFYFCGTGSLPWKSSDSVGMANEIKVGCIFTPSTLDKRISGLIGQMLKVEPDRRSSIDQLLDYLLQGTDRRISSTPARPGGIRPWGSASHIHQSPSAAKKSPVRWVDAYLRVGKRFDCQQLMLLPEPEAPVVTRPLGLGLTFQMQSILQAFRPA